MARKKIKVKEENEVNVDPNSDEFIQKTVTVFDWAYKHRRPLVLAATLVLLSAIGAIAFNHFSTNALAERSMTLSKGLESIVAPVLPAPDDAVPPPTDDDRLSFYSLQARATESLKAIGEVPAGAGGGVEVAKLLVEAASHYDLGAYDKAIAAYESLAGRGDKELDFLKPSIVEGLGLAFEAAGRGDDAKKRFDELSKMPGSAGELGKYHVARLEEKAGNVEPAKKLYKEVIDAAAERGHKTSRDYLFVHARERLLALDPKAEVPAPEVDGIGDIDPELLRKLLAGQQGGGLN